MALWNSVARAVSEATGRRCDIAQLAPLMGGRVSNAFLISDGATRYFVKTHNDGFARAYEWEARSLRQIAAAGVATPAVIATGKHGARSFLVLEYIAPAPPPSAEATAEALLRLHANTAPAFGADAIGYVSVDRRHRITGPAIGGNAQVRSGYETIDNTPSESWADFWCERRMRHRLAGCASAPEWDPARPRIEALLPVIRDGLAAHRPAPAMLHGDLNNLNWLARPDGSVVFIDAAFWYGDPEVDLAALEGGPPAGRDAFACYVRLRPRPPGFAWRLAVYRLWYLLSSWPIPTDPHGPILAPTLERIARGPTA